MKRIRRTSLALIAALLASGFAAPQERPVVETASGKVRGLLEEGVASCIGIPFAQPPIGELRWRAPQTPAPWEGIRDASTFGPHCPQAPIPGGDPNDAAGKEDCLYLNVWTPAERGDELIPVLFWIHGGGFVNGGTANPLWSGAAFARDGVVLVSANYRIGRFGFFGHPALSAENADDGRLGNYGILDQIAALEWVRENIRAFGGDPTNVTIFGESAGGVSVHHLMTATAATGLFSRAICESAFGRADNDTLPFLPLRAEEDQDSVEARGIEFAARHGIENEGDEALTALRALPADAITDGLNMFTFASQRAHGPCLDGILLRTHFEEVYRAGEEPPVPMIVGANDADSFFFGGTREEVFAPF